VLFYLWLNANTPANLAGVLAWVCVEGAKLFPPEYNGTI
jgi:hypothetical protein